MVSAAWNAHRRDTLTFSVVIGDVAASAQHFASEPFEAAVDPVACFGRRDCEANAQTSGDPLTIGDQVAVLEILALFLFFNN